MGATSKRSNSAPWRAPGRQPSSPRQSAPLVEQIKTWALSQKAFPDSAFRNALEYMLELWNGLTVFPAKLRGEDPGDYLLRSALAAIENPGTVTVPKGFD